MADWFDENDPEKQDWFSANSPSPTAAELSTLAAPEGSPQREDINRSVAGSLFETPGKYARDPTLAELIDASMPRSVQEAKLREKGIPMAPPLPEQGRFERGGVLGVLAPGLEAGETVARGLMPRTDSWGNLITDLGSFATPAVGSVQELIDAPENARKNYANMRAQMEGRSLVNLPFPEQLDAVTAAQQMPEGEEKQQALLNAGSNVVAQMIMAKAITHGLARPSPTLAERITRPRVEPSVGLEPPTAAPQMPATVPEPIPGAQPGAVRPSAPYQTFQPDWFKVKEPVSPGAAKQLRKLKAHKAQVEAIGGKVDPDKVTAKIAEIEGVPQEAASTKPDWVNQQIDAMSAPLEANGVANQIEALAAQRLTAKQIAQKLGLEPEQVSAVRAKRGIPSMEDRPGFEAWIKSRPPPEAPVQAQEGPSFASEAPGGVPVAGEPPPPGAGVPPEVPPSERGYAGMEPLPPEKTGITKAAIAEQREARGVPEIERQKQIDFGESLDRAKATLAEDPMAGQRLVDQLTAKPRSVTPEDTPLLIERMQQVQREFDRANKAVNEATPEQLESAKARLEHARGEYDKTVTATQNATSSTGAGLNSVKMILKEDYSLARMQSRKRAANNGKIDEGQLKEVEALHNRITELTDRLDALDRQRFGFRDVGKEAVAARKSGKRLTDYTGEAATRARERIQRQLHGLGAKPAPPTLLYDYAVVGADHLARGLTKFSDWSAQMLKEFGEKVKPHLQDLWKMARAVHDKTTKAFRTPEEARLERYKTRLAQDTAGVTAKIQRGDFTKHVRQRIVLDKAAYKMKGNLQRLKNEFERGVAKDAYRKMSKGDKFWQHFVGVERAMKLSSPAVFQKLGLAAMVREVLAPLEAGGGYAVSKVFPRLAKGTRYGGDLKTVARAEIKAKAALFTEGMKDSWENLMGRETGLEAISDKYGRQPDFWYNRIGKIHAAVKAPVKRAEFVRSLETRMDAAVKAGEDINHPEVMDRLATESSLDANRAIFQQNTVVSKFFSQLDRLHPAGGRTARFLFPVVKIPVNLFKELVTYNVGAPVAAAKIGRAYWKGIETLEPTAREAIIRQLTKGSVGGAAILWGYFNSKQVHDFLEKMPPWFEHTPIAMAIHEGSIIKELEGEDSKQGMKDLQKMAKYDIPFAYTAVGLTEALNPRNPNGWRDYLYGMIHGTVVPQAVSWTAKELDKPTPFNIFDKPAYRKPRNVVEAVTQGIPGLREDIPAKEFKEKKEPSVSQRRRAQRAARTRARKKAREED